jgi:type IV fimbrial biogenesis protein FimT
MKAVNNSRGFTLIEMATVVTVLAVVAAIAAPGMRSFAAGQKVKALAYDLTADLLLARSEALKRNTNVVITPVSGNWKNGWTVAAGVENLSTRNSSNEAISFTAATATVVPTSITFDVNGRASATVRMTVESSSSTNSTSKRCIQLDPSGRARSAVGACP